MHYFENRNVHISVTRCCIVGYGALWELYKMSNSNNKKAQRNSYHEKIQTLAFGKTHIKKSGESSYCIKFDGFNLKYDFRNAKKNENPFLVYYYLYI